MHRRLLIDRLTQYQQRHPDENSVVERILEVVNADPRCFERDCWLGHITGSAWILNQAGTHALLTHHKKLNRWLQLGGHSDGEPDTLQVAQREALEESGLMLKLCSNRVFDIDVHEIPARGDDPAHDHLDLRFLLQALDSDEFTISEESNDLAWVDMNRIADYTNEESVLRMVRKLPTFLRR